MKVLYLDCNAGAAGDMLTASLASLLPDKEIFIKKMNAAGIPNTTFDLIPTEKMGIQGLSFKVTVDGQQEESVDYDHDHSHEHSHAHSLDHDHEHTHDHAHSHGHDHNHSHDHGDEHNHAHNHDHCHEHDHAHEHSHDHEHSHSHAHRSMADIEGIVSSLNLSDGVKANVLSVYKTIAEAERRAHGVDVSEIHFHEVGTFDAISDITAFSLLIEELSPDRIVASPVRTGYGHVHCAHGILPVPAPATAYILEGIPNYGGEIEGEMCTPTGAALLKTFAQEFTNNRPLMNDMKIGYGMGKKDFEILPAVRSFYGHAFQE